MLKILSIHIPKTAGTSFYANLQDAFGAENCIELKRVDLQKNDSAAYLQELATRYRVIHGHFYFTEIESIYNEFKPKLVSWYRHPIERLISDYLFFIKRLNDDQQTFKEHHLQNLHRKNETLYTYAQRLETQNVLSRYLQNAPWKDFYFLGNMQHYTLELDRFSAMLGKKMNAERKLNTKPESDIRYDQLIGWMKEKILEWNTADMKLYEEILIHSKIRSVL